MDKEKLIEMVTNEIGRIDRTLDSDEPYGEGLADSLVGAHSVLLSVELYLKESE